MANFGFSQLTVVAPYAPHWREARSAIGAPELLNSAKETESLAKAVTDYTLVIGTGTLTYRKPEQRVLPLPGLIAPVVRELGRCGRVALVFGPEKHGLTREDLSHCHLFVEIPTDAGQPSMNLGQAVAVCLYELAAHVFPTGEGTQAMARPTAAVAPDRKTAISNDLELLAGLVEQVMDAAKYSPASMKEANRHDLRLLLRRLAPTEKDSKRILGLFRRILWRLKR
jgi:tRNA/rRNA methyltransferase